jgi:ornithine carbamoyltransferase
MTLQEHIGKLEGLNVAWVGDGNNVLHRYTFLVYFKFTIIDCWLLSVLWLQVLNLE